MALRYEKPPEEMDAKESEQYQLFETSQYIRGAGDYVFFLSH